MSEPEHFDVVILGSGQGGKALAWRLGRSGKKVAVVERRWVGGSCPAVACMPSKNELWSARMAHIVRHAAEFGTLTSVTKTDMRKVLSRKQDMVDREIRLHLKLYAESGAELIMGSGQFVGPKTIEVALNDGAASASSPAARLSSIWARTPPFPTFPVSTWPARSLTSRRSNSIIFRRI